MKKLITTTISFFICLIVFAQNRVITGTVTDESGNPVPGASVVIKGTRTGTSTDNDGRFRINAKTGDRLVISGVGLETKEVLIGNENTISVSLKRTTTLGSEVVVTGLGVRTQAKSLSYSVTSISADNIDGKKFGLKTWKRSGELDENSVRLSVGDKDFLPLKSMQAAVQVDGFRARVLFDFFFYSDKPRQLRGDFKLKLPSGASPFYFAFGGTEYFNAEKKQLPVPFVNYPAASKISLVNDTIIKQRTYGNNTLKEALVAPKQKAAYAFNEVVRGRVDPALMEWAGADIFSCSIYPIQQGKLHRVVIGYDINLAEAGNLSAFNLVLPYDNIPKKLDLDIIHTNQILHSIVPAIGKTNETGNRSKYHLENFKEKSFAINLRFAGIHFLQNDGAEKYFALTAEASLPQNPAGKAAENAVLLLDVSLSSQPDKFNIWLKMVEELLNNNRNTIKKFSVLCFNTSTHWWKEYYSYNNAYNVGEFLEFADQLSLMGATDLALALKEAAHPAWQKDKDMPKTMFLLSDGDASWGEDNLYQLSGIVPANNKVFAFTTGLSGTDTRVLDHICRESDGAVFSVLNEEEAQKVSQSLQFQPWRITGISLNGSKDILIAGRPYNIFSGQKLLITGRGNVQQGDELTIKLQQGQREKLIIIPAAYIISSNLTARVYGQTAVTQLEDFSFKTEDASVKYATYYKVAGQTCSWVMLESDNLYRRFGINTEASRSFIDSNMVNDIVKTVLAKEATEKSLGSAKEDMKAWLNKLQNGDVVDFSPDSAFTKYLQSLPESSFRVNVPTLNSKFRYKNEWFASTIEAVSKSILDYDQVMKSVKNEMTSDGKAEAFTIISSFAENNRNDLTLLRDVAFQLSNWELDGKAYELCRRIIASRPAEPATYKQIANSLVKMGKADLAILYYDIAYNTSWDNRFDGFDIINDLEYYKLLKAVVNGKYNASNTEFVKSRLKKIGDGLAKQNIAADEADLMIVITWNTENTDVDLHVREPNNEECYYGRKSTNNGGYLTNDATQGFGPETYILKKAPSGKYILDIDYYSSSRVQTSCKSKIFVTAYKDWGRSNETVFQKVVELKRSEKKNNRQQEEDDDDKKLKEVFAVTF